jgi:hypothetical protein
MPRVPRKRPRDTNAFSKKLENHAYAVALHQMFYNFTRIHQTLRVTPAMAAGVTDKLWDMTDNREGARGLGSRHGDCWHNVRINPDRIGEGFHVRTLSRYGKPETKFGFKTVADAQAFIDAERAKHKPGRRKKIV